MTLILYEVLIIPLQISFDFDAEDALNTFEIFVDAFFLTDIILTFNTGLLSNNETI